jgi:hypothetical protein
MKYYIYVSDMKINMLYEQIPRDIRTRIAAEIKLDLKILSLTLKDKKSEKTRYSKLDLIVDYIKKNFAVGTVDSPQSYFEGNLPMRWGPYGGGIGPYRRSEPEVVYFGGSTSSTTLGLGGSLKHVIGSKGDSKSQSGSWTYFLLSVLSKEFELQRFSIEYERPESPALDAVCFATKNMKGPKQNFEFLAKKLLCGTSMRFKCPSVLLGTPIYVALADL